MLHMGECVTGNLLWVGATDDAGDGFGWAVDCATGSVYAGVPVLGMTDTGRTIELPPHPGSANDRAWDIWSARCRDRIRAAIAP